MEPRIAFELPDRDAVPRLAVEHQVGTGHRMGRRSGKRLPSALLGLSGALHGLRFGSVAQYRRSSPASTPWIFTRDGR